jgi:hypothetical protein
MQTYIRRGKLAELSPGHFVQNLDYSVLGGMEQVRKPRPDPRGGSDGGSDYSVAGGARSAGVVEGDGTWVEVEVIVRLAGIAPASQG